MPSHEQWMDWCESGARIFSTCVRRSYMSIVLSSSGRVLGTGYNGAPKGWENCRNGGCPRAGTSVQHGSNYSNCVAVHAEANALLHSDRSAREGGTLYVNGPPCWDCSKLIAGSGIKKVVFKPDLAYAGWWKCAELLESVGIQLYAIGSIFGNNDPEPGGSLGCGTPQEVDVAIERVQSDLLDRADRSFGSLGYVSLDIRHDGDYTGESTQTNQGDSQ